MDKLEKIRSLARVLTGLEAIVRLKNLGAFNLDKDNEERHSCNLQIHKNMKGMSYS